MWYSESILVNVATHHQNVLKKFRHKKLGHFRVAKFSGLVRAIAAQLSREIDFYCSELWISRAEITEKIKE